MPILPKILIAFAGVPGTSKSPIAHYLSIKLGIPVFSNDVIRTEVKEDLGNFDFEEYCERRDKRIHEAVERGLSIIYDASADREWVDRKAVAEKFGYRYFIISIDLSRNFILKLYEAKGYADLIPEIEKCFDDHEKFLAQFSADVGIHIADKDFPNRLEIALKAVTKWLRSID
ncbi:hypothetical protein HYV44_02015 [Candidatus Microgenomates bacterium]|nr:hypothetical protein [Candidatus Microgenomates bacterium]